MEVIFLSGPYRADSPWGIVQNIRHAEKYALKYWKQGYAVICPHKNSALLDGADGLDDSVWLNGDIELMKRSDIIVMIPGWEQSEGVKGELALAVDLGKKVIFEKEAV